MKAQLLLLLLVIPVIAYAASWGLQAKLDSDLRAALASNPELQARDLSMLTMDKFCSLLSDPGATTLDPSARKDIGETCDFLSNLHIMQTTAVVAVVIAIVLMVVVALAGRLARGRRVLLLLAFAPLLHLTMVTLSILMVLHAALGMATLWYGESALIGRVHVGIMLALGLGAVFGVLILLRAQFQAVRKATSVVIGKRLD